MADKLKIITAISATIIAALACVSEIVNSSSENERAVVIIKDKPVTTEYTTSEQITTSVITSSAKSATTIVTSRTTTVSTTHETSMKSVSTDVPVSYETEVSDYVEDTLYIDINTAGRDDFIRLKGIGEYLADEIISYRDENGGFNNIEEIMNVSGIGEKIFAEIAEYIYVENPVYPDEDISEEIISYEPEHQEIQEDIPQETQLTLEDCIPININTADKEILMLLSNVDETAADEIIQLRSQLGAYSDVYELLYLQSLSQGQIAEIIEYLTV